MSTQNLNIVVTTKGAQQAIRTINMMGQSAGNASASFNQLNVQMNRLNVISNSFNTTFVNINRNLRTMQSNVERTTSAWGFLRKTLIALAAIQSASKLVEYADAYQGMKNKIKTVTNSQAELNFVMKELAGIADRSRMKIEDVSKIYQRTSSIANVLGRSQEEVLRFTEALGNATAISGSETSESSAALLQFSQALGANRLSGQELNSVLEQLPILADIIATKMGQTRFQLKGVAKEGKITSEVMFDAVLEMESFLAQRKNEQVATLGQSFTRLNNKLKLTFGEFLEANKVFEGFSATVDFIIENLDTLGKVATVVGSVIATKLLAEGIALATRGLLAMNAAILANPLTALTMGLVAAGAALYAFKDDIKMSEDGFVTLGDVGRQVLKDLSSGWDDVANAIGGAIKKFGEFYSSTQNPPMPEGDELIVDPMTGQVIGTAPRLKKNSPGAFEQYGSRETAIRAQKELEALEAEDYARQISRIKPKGNMPVNPTKEKGFSFEDGVRQLEDLMLKARQQEAILRAGGATTGIKLDKPEEFQERQKQLEELYKTTLDIEQRLEDAGKTLGGADSPMRRTLGELGLSYERQVSLNAELEKQIDLQKEVAKWAEDRNKKLPGTIQEMRDNQLAQFTTNAENNKSRIANSDDFDTQLSVQMMTLRDQTENTAQYMAETFAGIFGPGGTLVTGFADAFAAGIVHAENFADIVGSALTNLKNQIIQTLISSVIQAGLNALINSVITASTAASALEAAWYGPAYLASVATLGGAAATGTAALAAGRAQVMGGAFLEKSTSRGAGILSGSGFASGGFTGMGARDQIAGVVHGQEFVMNAAATQRIGVDNLERMQRGDAPTGGANITINNLAPGVDVQAHQRPDGDIEIMVNKILAEKGPNMVASQFSDPNSPSSKALSSTFGPRRRS